MDARTAASSVHEACRRLKADSYTSIVPAVVLVDDDAAAFTAAFEAGADEVLRLDTGMPEALLRLDVMLRRSDRDTVVHPSTRLPGSHEIEAEIMRRIDTRRPFGVCYADLDHFKEYNDRYSYAQGDRVIRVLARVLHDVVKGTCGEDSFVGHIGGDDFIFIVPFEAVEPACAEVIEVFDLLVPYQYTEEDRRVGHFLGKDRRGQMHRVPLMSVSIGVVTNQHREFIHAAEVSELATEMKAYAKSLPGSVFVLDRRQYKPTEAAPMAPPGSPPRGKRT